MKTQGRFLLIVAVAFLSGVFILQNRQSRESSSLALATKAAFVKLDAKIARCTQAAYQLNVLDTTRQLAPLFENLGDHQFAISNVNERAQAYFNQGLRLSYAFNHAESHRAFMEAARLSPKAAMAYWGQAYALGPNINDPLPDEERKKHAYEAIQKALKLKEGLTQKETDLIDALSQRYSPDADKDISELNAAYLKAMERVVAAHAGDADVQTLYADAVMNTMPWDYWDKQGNPHPNIAEAKAALEKAISLNQDHPGAHHLYIHMVELPQPELGVPSAEKLGRLMPAAGHLVHMPAHIFIRVGRYKDAARVNVDAIAADEDYISQCYSQGAYPLGYYPHNIHFLWSAATLLGDSETAMSAARKTAEKSPAGELANLTFLQDYASSPMLAYVRFGKWNEVLTIPYPGRDFKHMNLIWHYGRGVAFVRKNNIKEAEEELAAIEVLMKDPELEQLMANTTNPSSAIAKVAYEVVAGEIEAARGNTEKAIAHFQQGIAYEDALMYNEPTAWHIPVRQSLGALLLKANKAREAEKVYLEDLKINRNNGWSLLGLHESLKAQGRKKEAQQAGQAFKRSWADADVAIASSVF